MKYLMELSLVCKHEQTKIQTLSFSHLPGVYYKGIIAGSGGSSTGGIRIVDLGREPGGHIRVLVNDDVTPAPHPFKLPKPS